MCELCLLLDSLSPIGHDELGKSGGVVLMRLWGVLTDDIVIPVVLRFRFFHVLKIYFGVFDNLGPILVF